uniref:Pyrroline-5-carboxylate reductase catalytic N-terminal domain-containing protein n=1 Tax=Bionectria ochroleuca TaxID=29856 RepID=A0A8H7K1K2_BIOOC
MNSNRTLAIVGCGNMGSAILSGLLDATRSQSDPPVSSFIAVTNTVESADRLRCRFEQDKSRLLVRHGASVWAMEQADIVILGCKPYMAELILGEEGAGDALSGSSCRGPYVVRAMPNVAAKVRKSMTIIEHNPTLPDELNNALSWIFSQIGEVKVLATDQFDIGSMLVGSSMAILSVGLDGILDGCVMEGIRRSEALEMAAQSLLGMAELLRQGEQLAAYRESVSSPRGLLLQEY